jgi:hypothetical protein
VYLVSINPSNVKFVVVLPGETSRAVEIQLADAVKMRSGWPDGCNTGIALLLGAMRRRSQTYGRNKLVEFILRVGD